MLFALSWACLELAGQFKPGLGVWAAEGVEDKQAFLPAQARAEVSAAA